jgi:DNA-directed RNA polymerase specialized sigma24 family protein
MKKSASLPLVASSPVVASSPLAEAEASPSATATASAASTVESRRTLRLTDSDLPKVLRGVLRSEGIDPREWDDLVAETLARLCASSFLPDHDEGLRMYACGVARRVAWGFRRDAARRPATERIEDVEQLRARTSDGDALEARLILDKALADKGIRALRGLRWFLRRVQGEDCAEIATTEKGTVRDGVWSRSEYARKRLHDRIMETALLVAVLLLAWSAAKSGDHPRQDVANPDVAPRAVEPGKTKDRKAERAAPEPTSSHPSPASVQEGESLRAAALAECKARRWEACLEGLGRAAEMDPDGDRSAEVGAARDRALGALEAKQPSEK